MCHIFVGCYELHAYFCCSFRAEAELKGCLAVSHDWNDFCDALDKKKLIQAPFCGEIPCEDAIKKDSARYDTVVSCLYSFFKLV